MLRDFGYKLKNLDGTDGEMNGAPITVANEVIPALQAVAPGRILSGEQKVARYDLALRAFEGDVQDLSRAELDLIKECVGFFSPVFVCGQVTKWAAIDYVPTQPTPDPEVVEAAPQAKNPEQPENPG